jgi:23S rRNA (guanosine2251-2'-O)-methyltransferase
MEPSDHQSNEPLSGWRFRTQGKLAARRDFMHRTAKPKPEPRSDVLYGINAVKEAVESRPVEHILVAEGAANPRLQQIIDRCRAGGVSIRFVPRAALERRAGTTHHQDILAVCAAKAYEGLEALLEGNEKPLLVVLDGVEDPANLGAVIRTAAGAGAAGIVIPERRAAGLSPAVARAAAGALEHARVARVPNLVRALAEAKERGVWVYGFEPGAATLHYELDYRGPCALVFGGEEGGLHRLVREVCDRRASIPLRGEVESLNVSAAAAVVLYEAVRQRSEG